MYYRGEVTIAVCPGSFDPLTLGHLDIVRRARSLFDEVVLGVARNSSKSALLTAEQRVEIARAALAVSPGLEDVRVEIVPGLLVDFCREVGAAAVVKGLRGGADFDAELPMALMNRHLVGVETVFVPGDPALAHVASSLVKDVARFGGPVDDLVPAGVGDLVRQALADRAAGASPAGEQSQQGTPTTEGTGR
ncbi:pantetheine-phosphate adenylyltransferase [Oerskovia jenensis]